MTTMPTHGEWLIEFTFPSVSESIRMNANPEILVGRLEPEQASMGGLDLTAYGGKDYGVSRRHAIIRWEGTQIVLIDLGSNNGTILNGERLQPNIPQRLSDEDIIYFGHLKTIIHFNPEFGRLGIVAQRIDFDLSNLPMKAHGQRILVVEDDPVTTKLYQLSLEKAGFSVHITRDVVSAIRALNHITPALILLDLKLPGVHGLELCRYVRRDSEGADIPIIVISGKQDEESIQEAMDSGVDVFMRKPVDVNQLSLIIAAIVRDKEASNPAFGTKMLTGTASIDYIPPTSHQDAIVIFVEGQRQPIGTIIQNQVTMGRQAVNPNNRNHIDLEPYGAFDKGVSRTHALIERRGDSLYIQDLESSNGTFVNGHSLKPKEQTQLHNGDEVRLGQLRMHIYLLSETEVAPH